MRVRGLDERVRSRQLGGRGLGREQPSGLRVKGFAFVALSGKGKERNGTVGGGVWSEFCFFVKMDRKDPASLDAAGGNDPERAGAQGAAERGEDGRSETSGGRASGAGVCRPGRRPWEHRQPRRVGVAGGDGRGGVGGK